MSKKSILLSILSLLLFAAVLVGIIFLFKTHFMFVIIGILLFFFPVMMQKKAIDAANGRIDAIIAKFVVPALAVAMTFFAIMSVAFWIK